MYDGRISWPPVNKTFRLEILTPSCVDFKWKQAQCRHHFKFKTRECRSESYCQGRHITVASIRRLTGPLWGDKTRQDISDSSERICWSSLLVLRGSGGQQLLPFSRWVCTTRKERKVRLTRVIKWSYRENSHRKFFSKKNFARNMARREWAANFRWNSTAKVFGAGRNAVNNRSSCRLWDLGILHQLEE